MLRERNASLRVLDVGGNDMEDDYLAALAGLAAQQRRAAGASPQQQPPPQLRLQGAHAQLQASCSSGLTGSAAPSPLSARTNTSQPLSRPSPAIKQPGLGSAVSAQPSHAPGNLKQGLVTPPQVATSAANRWQQQQQVAARVGAGLPLEEDGYGIDLSPYRCSNTATVAAAPADNDALTLGSNVAGQGGGPAMGSSIDSELSEALLSR